MKTINKYLLVIMLALLPLTTISSIFAQNGLNYQFILKWGEVGSGNGQFDGPYGVAVDSNDNVYVTDIYNHRVQKFNSTGGFLTKWGTYGTGDGQFNGSRGIAIDSNDNVYVADSWNNRVQKFSSTGSLLLKWGTSGTGDGEFDRPIGVAVDSNDNVYVTDFNNHRVQKFNSTGGFLTKWGTYGTGDGQFNGSRGIAIDSNDNVYVGDLNNYRIQKFDSAGAFITEWGTSGTGDGEFSRTQLLCVDLNDKVFVADLDNDRIQKFESAGGFIFEWGTSGTGDGEFNGPSGVAADQSGNIYVTDFYNNRIQKFKSDTIGPTIIITSPEDNGNYASTSIYLSYTVSENVDWTGYSLDEQGNVTITGGTTLEDLLDGAHNVIVYANDTFGNMGASTLVQFTIDTTSPNITAVSQIPTENNVMSTDVVKVNATITDETSGVKKGTLAYTTGGTTTRYIGMTKIEGDIWTATIPAYPEDTNVTYEIKAEDFAENEITTGVVFGYKYQYSIIPEFPSLMIIPMTMILTLLAIMLYRKKYTTLH